MRAPAATARPSFGANAPPPPRNLSVAQAPTAEGRTVAPASRPAPRRRRWPIVVITAGVLALAGTFALLAGYRQAARAADELVTRARRSLNDDTYLGRVNATDMLVAGVEPPGALGRAADALVRFAGRPGLAGPEADRRALLARIEAERVGRDAERDRLPKATEALAEARGLAPDALDTRLADITLRLFRQELEAAQTALDALPGDQRDTAAAQQLYAEVALARGDRPRATDRAATARGKDAGFVPAQLLVLQLQAERGDTQGALEGLKVLGERHRSHVGVYVAYQRLRVQEGEQAAEAVTALQSVLEKNGEVLSPDQRALIQDTMGLYYVRSGDIESARTAYTIANKTVPDDPRYSVGLARLDLLEYKLDAAERVLREATRQHPGEPAFITELARAHLLRGDPSGALAELKRLSAPDIDALLLIARSQLDLSDPNGALETLAAAERQAPALLDVDYYRLLAKVRAGVTAEAALKQLGEPRATGAGEQLWEAALPGRAHGMALAHRGDLDAAATVLTETFAAHPRDFLSAFELCLVEARRLRGREALKACRAALTINPHNLKAAELSAEIAEATLDAGAVIAALEPLRERTPEMTRRLARAYVALERVGSAAALVPERREGAPEDATDRSVRGLVLLATGRGEEALPLLQAAADELDKDAWAQIALADLLLDQGDARKAAAVYRKAGKLSRLPFASLGAARAAMRNNDWQQALVDARVAERQARRSLSHARLRGEALAIQGRVTLQTGGRRGLRAAARFFAEALKAEKELPAALVGNGLLAEQQQRFDEAVRLYGRAIQVAPKDPEAHYLLGRLLLQTPGTTEQGRDMLNQARVLDPRGRFGSLAKGLLQPTP
ncbi:MAG: tetratricopeptide repeat protein [Myxococcales bacterium]|nr:tetratricopeptide repeat protein [Myxococcales bacterium]